MDKQQVEEEVAMFCLAIYREILQKGMGYSKLNAIVLPERVYHIRYQKLCELASAADSLQLKSLVDLTSRTLARIIEGKTPEEIREIFNLPDDLTEEEKLEPLKNVTDDPRI
uniref:SKP1 component dimerisation domain-containing protein n=1 Tax=Chenopodium quinoa TaxID=63459 RepID=A0A803MKJ8_CHEQI